MEGNEENNLGSHILNVDNTEPCTSGDTTTTYTLLGNVIECTPANVTEEEVYLAYLGARNI